MFDYSKECTVLLAKPRSSRATLAIDFSWSLFWFLLRMSDKIFCSIPVSPTPSRAHAARNSGQIRTMFSLLEVLFL